MGIFDRFLICSDIDGTFLAKGSKLVPRNLEAVEVFKREGGRFTFSTGRMMVNLRSTIPTIAEIVNCPTVLTNGTCLYDYVNDTVLEAIYMEPTVTREMISYVDREFPAVGIRASMSEGFCYLHLTDRLKKDFAGIRSDDIIQRALDEWNFTNVFKIVFRGEPEELDRLRARIEPMYGDRLTFAKANPTFFEAQNGGTSKATMVRALADRLAKDGERPFVICVGDNENDIEMLRAADFSACPENAIPEVKETVDLVLCSCNEGVIGDLVDYLRDHPDLGLCR